MVKDTFNQKGQLLLTEEEWKKKLLLTHVPTKVQDAGDQFAPNVTLDFLYKPHTITALIVAVGTLVYSAFMHGRETDPMYNTQKGFGMAALFLVGIGMLVFPNGPFIRPHPLLWRIGFGVGVVYQLFLIIILFQDKPGARAFFKHLDPSLGVPLVEKAYAENCELTWATFSDCLFDVYFLSHYLGWVVKSAMVRDWLACWFISITWELIEIATTHMLPNFAECWWDQWILDVMLANALGIATGIGICRYLEVRQYEWRGINSYDKFSQKLNRALQQLTPAAWTAVRWGKMKTVKRFLAFHGVVLFLHVEELNHFFLKHLLWVPPKSKLNVIRLFVMTFVGLPSIRQYYNYVTNPECKRLGTQAFMTCCIFTTEILICIKFSDNEFPNRMPEHIKQYTVFGVGGYCVCCILATIGIIYFNKTPMSMPTTPVSSKKKLM